ncbi:putative ALA-interacting subunit 4 isoform X1 [Vigna umbellata]|uniref:putative ALA-interacting subunit 4 isoform X1 n=1 Tax=Vigna umbellata TaxID=87088 RepID=UPI001F5FA9F7|nr:putative ALA-interacting subunit 4 isoform X1 [Vigna umbellata]
MSDEEDATTSHSSSKKPIYTEFSQQELPEWKPILTPGWVITTLFAVGVIFIPIGLATVFSSESVDEIVIQYDESCLPSSHVNDPMAYIQSHTTNKTCVTKWTVEHRMEAPVYIYYQLDNYYQNHRRYMKSRNDKQLWSKAEEGETLNCYPEDMTKEKQPIVPCGLIAWSIFNDTYKFVSKNKNLTVNRKDIAWGSDRRFRFGSDVYPKNFQRRDLIGGGHLNESLPLRQQEDLIVWMRTAALPTFRKLYGKIEVDLEAKDEIEIVIENNYNTYMFGGTKKLVLSTTTLMGGRNPFVGTAYLFIGSLSLFFTIGFILLYVIKPRPLGDPSYLSWNKNPGGMIK